MKKYSKKLVLGIAGLAIFGLGYVMFTGLTSAYGCGWAGSGGQGYAPQRGGAWQKGPMANAPTITQDQAIDIVSNHIRKLNPNLKVGRVNDAGSFFEAEILSSDNEVVQLMGVDKQSGRIMLIN